MRLSKEYRDTIKQIFYEVFGEGKIYLFGSRVDNNQRGGDIDLYLVVDKKLQSFDNKLKFLAKIKRKLGEQKIDVVFNKDSSRLIEQEAKRWGVEL